MTTTNLRTVLEEAASAIDTYKHPDISEARKHINAICKAADIGWPGDDEITGISFYRGEITVSTRYSIRGCEQVCSFEFPESIVDDIDPVNAARIWCLTRRRDVAANQVRQNETALDRSRKYLEEADLALKQALNETSCTRQ